MRENLECIVKEKLGTAPESIIRIVTEMKKSEGAPAVMQYLSFLQGVCQERDLDPSPENYSREVMGESVIIIDFCNQRESPSQVTRTPDTGENLIEEGGERDDTG